MILNEHQYKITRTHVRRFRQAIEELESDPPSDPDIHPLAPQVECAAMDSMQETLQGEMDEYDHLKSSGPLVIEVDAFGDLAYGFIKARIACGLSQQNLAERMNLETQQIQRYESDGHLSASYSHVCEAAEVIRKETDLDAVSPVVFAQYRRR